MTNQPLSDIPTYDVKRIMTASVCETLDYLIHDKGIESTKYKMNAMFESVAREVILIYLANKSYPTDDFILSMITGGTKSLSYPKKEDHCKQFCSLIRKAIMLMQYHELEPIGGVLPVSVSYGQHIITTVMDGIVLDTKRGYRYPLVIDFSRTTYEPEYNPILYRCDAISKSFHYSQNVNVCVISETKRWFYNSQYYSNMIESTVEQRAESITNNYIPYRFGWWCAGCEFRGSCFKYKSSVN